MKTKIEFSLVYKTGIKKTGKYTTIFFLNNQTSTKLGITVTKKIGNAVIRNRTKRRYREIFRLHLKKLLPGFWIIFHANPNIVDVDYHEIEEDIINLLKTKQPYK